MKKSLSNITKIPDKKPRVISANIVGVNLNIKSMAEMLALGRERRKRWKARHEEFIHVVLTARSEKRLENGEEPLVIEPLSPAIYQAGLLHCEHCGRKFNETAFAKHTTKCKESKGNQQADQQTAEQKEAKMRFVNRMKYYRDFVSRKSTDGDAIGDESLVESTQELTPSDSSCAVATEKAELLLKALNLNFSEFNDEFWQNSIVEELIQQKVFSILQLPPMLESLQISNCNKSVTPTACEIGDDKESEHLSGARKKWTKPPMREAESSPTKYSSPSAVSSVSSVSLFSSPLGRNSNPVGTVDEGSQQKQAGGDSKHLPSHCSHRHKSKIEPIFLTDLVSPRERRTMQSDKCFKLLETTSKTTSHHRVPSESKLESSDHTTLLKFRSMLEDSRQHPSGQCGKPKRENNYLENNCKSSLEAWSESCLQPCPSPPSLVWTQSSRPPADKVAPTLLHQSAQQQPSSKHKHQCRRKRIDGESTKRETKKVGKNTACISNSKSPTCSKPALIDEARTLSRKDSRQCSAPTPVVYYQFQANSPEARYASRQCSDENGPSEFATPSQELNMATNVDVCSETVSNQSQYLSVTGISGFSPFKAPKGNAPAPPTGMNNSPRSNNTSFCEIESFKSLNSGNLVNMTSCSPSLSTGFGNSSRQSLIFQAPSCDEQQRLSSTRFSNYMCQATHFNVGNSARFNRPPSESGGSRVLVGFCTQCGEGFSVEARFCALCGAGRKTAA